MPLTPVDKVKINKYMKDHAIGDIYYLDMVDALGKKAKVTDMEFLEFFTDCILKELAKEGKVSFKQIAKYITTVSSFIGWLHEADVSIDLMLIDKINSFQEAYEEYLSRNSLEKENDLIDECIKELNETIKQCYPTEETNESVFRYLAMIQALEAEVKRIEKELTETQKQFEISQKNLSQKQEKVDELHKDTNMLHGEVSKKEAIITRLNSEITTLKNRVTELEKTLSTTEQQKEELIPYKSKCDELSTLVSELQQTISKYKQDKQRELEHIKSIEETCKKEAKIEELIFEKLIECDATSQELLGFIRANGTSTDITQVKEVLKRLKRRINITEPTFSATPKHHLTPAQIETNRKFRIDVEDNTKHLDIMLVSDCHIELMDKKGIEIFDAVNDYCTKQGIHLILNLGDFFNGDVYNYSFQQATRDYSLVESVIKELPSSPSIYHAILGGNHDRKITRYGFNPISMIAEEREDIIDLGYTHSTIELINQENVIGEFDIHHPDSFEFPIDLNDSGMNTESLTTYINKIYNKQHRSRNASYIDIFGHTHKAQFNPYDSYYFVPSLFEGRSKKGACHLRIYFDNLKSIDSMVLMPLAFNTCNHLVKNNEMIYKKMLTR